MDGVQAVGDLGGDGAGAGDGQRPFFDHRGQRATAQELHDQIGAAVGQRAEVGDVDGVGAADLGGELGFAEEARRLGLVGRVE